MRSPFPPWTNQIRNLLGAGAIGGLIYAVLIVTYGFSPNATDVGYEPTQPVPFSHRIHAGQLGMDCRYCHQSVERNAHAAVPATQTCMGCHERILPESTKLAPVRQSWASGEPVQWVRVHDLPDYAYFDHVAHVQKGVGCASCHGRIDQMEVVWQTQPLSMGWCLECHRNPEPNLRPKHLITKMDYAQESPDVGERLRAEYQVNPREDCSTCHR